MCYFSASTDLEEKFVQALVKFSHDDAIGNTCLQFLIKMLKENVSEKCAQILLSEIDEIEQLQESTNEKIFESAIVLLELMHIYYY